MLMETALDYSVEVSENIRCPFCGQRFEVAAECEPGEILGLDVLEN
jgi:hypothetical protein